MGKKITDHLQNIYPSVAAMCQHYGISKNAYYGRLNMGMSQKDALENRELPSKRGVYDHASNYYRSETEMCRAYHISTKTYHNRMDRGMTQEEALTIPSVMPAENSMEKKEAMLEDCLRKESALYDDMVTEMARSEKERTTTVKTTQKMRTAIRQQQKKISRLQIKLNTIKMDCQNCADQKHCDKSNCRYATDIASIREYQDAIEQKYRAMEF